MRTEKITEPAECEVNDGVVYTLYQTRPSFVMIWLMVCCGDGPCVWVRNLIETNIRRLVAALWSLRVTKYNLLSI
jgi:hypothetical protein